MGRSPASPGVAGKLRLSLRIVRLFVRTAVLLRRRPLSQLVPELAAQSHRRPSPCDPAHLDRAVTRTLDIVPARARCLHRTLVMYVLLQEHGMDADVVIGVKPGGGTNRAHSWLEWRGNVLGPFPGRADHVEIARYRSDGAAGAGAPPTADTHREEPP